ncbi:hypothetical protein G9A89_007513 [Geosiphon pyriformis]|nr:hypothetical protein G9A89_007513 [Geosiphon pyriformis]
MYKSKLAQETIEKRMEKFCFDKDSIIRSVLGWPFWKAVLDHLVVDDELVLESEEVKLKIDRIIKVLPDLWTHQYAPLAHVRDDAFSGVMDVISLSKLLLVIGGLPDGKAAELSGITNKLWKHGSEKMMKCLLVLLNVCLSVVSALWKRAWVSMILKPYDWNRVLINTCPIALIKTARKILSKIFSDRISFMCSKFNVLHGDNFSVLKGTSIQSPVFAVGSVVEDAFKKNRELWLVLQDMHKAYNSVGWHHLRTSLRCIKMCDRFVEFFGGIHEDRVNRVMTDFGLSNGYRVKRHEHLCGYHIDMKFVTKTGRIKNSGGMSSFFAVGAFVNDMIWVGDCQSSMQYALNIASDFFSINNISINNEKMDVRFVFLSISGQPIFITKKGKVHRYLDIFLSTEELSKPSLAKAHSDVCFFVHTVLRKVIMDKQFSYLVLAALQPIVNILVKKGFKSKAHLPCDFLDAALHHPSLYGLKSFEQVQSKAKVASLIFFSNVPGILGYLFKHRCLDLQLCVSLVNNFLADVVKIFLDNGFSLVNNLPNAFCHPDHFSMSLILGESLYFDSVWSLKYYGVAFGDWIFDKKGLDPWGPVPLWFVVVSKYLLDKGFFSSGSSGSSGTVYFCGLNILKSDVFSSVWDGLHGVWSGCFEVYTNGSLMGAGSANVLSGAAAYFLALDLSIGVRVCGLLSSTMAELQAVTFALECVLFSCSVLLFLDSQAAIDACVSELSSEVLDFHNCCWVKHRHVFNLIRDKNLSVSWAKVRGYAGVSGNVKADRFADEAAGSFYVLPVRVCERFLVAENTVVLGNAHHFVRDLFRSVCRTHWEVGPGRNVVSVDILGNFDWVSFVRI